MENVLEKALESSENFEAYATIGAGYWMVEEVNKRLNVRTGIDAMIDKATGFDKKLESDAAKELIPIFEDIISAKKFLKIDYSKDEELLNSFRQLVV